MFVFIDFWKLKTGNNILYIFNFFHKFWEPFLFLVHYMLSNKFFSLKNKKLFMKTENNKKIVTKYTYCFEDNQYSNPTFPLEVSKKLFNANMVSWFHLWSVFVTFSFFLGKRQNWGKSYSLIDYFQKHKFFNLRIRIWDMIMSHKL